MTHDSGSCCEVPTISSARNAAFDRGGVDPPPLSVAQIGGEWTASPKNTYKIGGKYEASKNLGTYYYNNNGNKPKKYGKSKLMKFFSVVKF